MNIQPKSQPQPMASPSLDATLEQYYGQLREWAALLTCGDVWRSQDLVHDLCLHLAVTMPDLGAVKNLDGYLYTCMRHLYLSQMARSSRDALRLVTLEEFDSIKFVLQANTGGDPLQQQNDLRSICSYAVWRKAQAKSASYFILRFFHGYFRSEIAALALVPLSTIDPKLTRMRSEVHLYLQDPGKLQFTSREQPPAQPFRWAPLSTLEMFNELRATILRDREGECLPPEELLAVYEAERPEPVSCALLSHLVSCMECLAVIDGYFGRPTLNDREPLDSTGGRPDGSGRSSSGGLRELMRSVRKESEDVREQRPKSLSIAVDGKILASHAIKAETNVLSVRIEKPQDASFIEVFTEQGVRLILIPVGELPPEGAHEQQQQVMLRDNRRLGLRLSFDGLGLNTEATYVDPALASGLIESDAPEVEIIERLVARTARPLGFLSGGRPRLAQWIATRGRIFRPAISGWLPALACVVLIACGVGYYMLHVVRPLDASALIRGAIDTETERLRGGTEHQVLRIEVASEDGKPLERGTVELWKDGDSSRYMRRVYDSKHRLIAAEWRRRDNVRGSYAPVETDDAAAAKDLRELSGSGLWQEGLSADTLRQWKGSEVQARAKDGGYELDVSGAGTGNAHVISAVLVLDHDLHPVQSSLLVRAGAELRSVRLVQTDYEVEPVASVPDAVFDLGQPDVRSTIKPRADDQVAKLGESSLAELQIGVLYQLSALDADTDEPIQVTRTADGHVLLQGKVAGKERKWAIMTQLRLLPNARLLQVRLLSPEDSAMQRSTKTRGAPGAITAYEVDQTAAPTDAIMRGYLQSKGMSGSALDAAVLDFSRDAMGHAQHALQHASALNRLASDFSTAELGDIYFTSQQQWAAMVEKHTAALQEELKGLHRQLALLDPAKDQPPEQVATAIGSPKQFAKVANLLLLRTQRLNQRVADAFALGEPVSDAGPDITALIAETDQEIPLDLAGELTSFAARLKSADLTEQDRKLSQNQK